MSATIISAEAERDTPPGAMAMLGRRLRSDPMTLVSATYLIVLSLVALFAPVIAPNDPLAQSILHVNLPPSAAHLLGTDQFGRDVLSRVLYGSRASLELGLVSPLVAAVVGSLIGILGGYFGGIVDRMVGRFIDLLLSFPILLLGIIVAAALGPGFWNLVMALVLAFAPRFARIARASTLSIRNEPFVEAAVACGVRHPRIIIRHIVPNIAGSIAVLITLWISSAIQLEATLSFLGLGTSPPRPSWGNIIRDGLNNLFGSPWPIVSAGLAITLTVLAFNLLGDAVRDVLDPELRE